MPLVDYLANKYLSADTSHDRQRSSKKRKRKAAPTASSGVTIADDDTDSWTQSTTHNNTPSDNDDNTPTIVSDKLPSGLTVPKKSKWIRIGASAPTDADQAAADAILASAAAEQTAQRDLANDDEAPQILPDPSSKQIMASGAAAGLQTAAQISAAIAQRSETERAALEASGLSSSGLASQTIYRDASGRVINVRAKQAEAAASAAAADAQARAEIRAARGDVQNREADAQKQQLRDMASQGVARRADDEALNADLRARERWNDPMAKMLSKKTTSSSAQAASGSGRAAASREKTYQGAFDPNRYGIRPGWRWDGVDRSNGFERKWFAARNKARDRADLEYMWEMDE